MQSFFLLSIRWRTLASLINHVLQRRPSVYGNESKMAPLLQPTDTKIDPFNIGLWMMLCDDIPCTPGSNITEIDEAWTKTKELVFSCKVPIIKAKCTTRSTCPKSSIVNTGAPFLFYTPGFQEQKGS
ncbi:uncharacterized protein CEXT_317021 [Caerostris extrusa]|uniref:Uncharacterized protein n=1 Tax=Caerostris extrusa TaxID=172846 RepID=A0AAV4MUG1_CAEEX|nr:uncharacterized protein CEXT_317021 [Caerostris extrusa]